MRQKLGEMDDMKCRGESISKYPMLTDVQNVDLWSPAYSSH